MEKQEVQSLESTPVVHPLYVLVMGVLGGGIGWALFQWNYIVPKNAEGLILNEFWVWLFLIMCFMALLAIFALPAWAVFIDLFKNHVLKDKNNPRKTRTILIVVLCGIILGLFVIASNALIRPVRSDLFTPLPANHSARVQIMYACVFAVVLPIALSILLVFYTVRKNVLTLPNSEQSEQRLFELAGKLNGYRNLLQNLLVAGGIILGMVPVITAGLIAFLVKLADGNGNNFPIELVIIYGLLYSILLVLLYVPTYMEITAASRNLRDRLCPITTLSNLKDAVDKRKMLEDYLHINEGLVPHLTTGIFTLAPFVSSLLSGLLGKGF
jgi:hypothetical protein